MRLRKNYLVGRFVHLKKTQPATTTNVRNAELQISDWLFQSRSTLPVYGKIKHVDEGLQV